MASEEKYFENQKEIQVYISKAIPRLIRVDSLGQPSDGIRTKFNTSSPISGEFLLTFINGVLYAEGKDFIRNNQSTITFQSPPPIDSAIICVYVSE